MVLPTLVVVSGAPGTGKTRLAHALATAIGCPAVCRDELKEGMVYTHGPTFAATPGDELTQRTFPLFFSVVRLLLEGGVSVVAEAAFQDRVWRIGLEPLLPVATLRVIRCHVPDDTARARRVTRMQEPQRRAHDDADPRVVTPSAFAPISLAAPSLVVDTTSGYVPDLERIVSFVRAVIEAP